MKYWRIVCFLGATLAVAFTWLFYDSSQPVSTVNPGSVAAKSVIAQPVSSTPQNTSQEAEGIKKLKLN